MPPPAPSPDPFEDEVAAWTGATASLPSLSGSDKVHGGLRDLDGSLRCQICRRPYRIPVLLAGCGHTYCSECVRPFLSARRREGKRLECPSCREPVASETTSLVPNRALADAVARFVAVRGGLRGRLGRAGGVKLADKGKIEKEGEKEGGRSRRRVRGGLRRAPKRLRRGGDDDDDDDDGDASDDDVVMMVPASASAAPPEELVLNPRPTVYHRGYSRKRLVEHLERDGLPTDGNEATLRDRIDRFRLKQNAWCDAGDAPRTMAELVREFREEERARTAEQRNRSFGGGGVGGIRRQEACMERLKKSRTMAGGGGGSGDGEAGSGGGGIVVASGDANFDRGLSEGFRRLIAEGRRNAARARARNGAEVRKAEAGSGAEARGAEGNREEDGEPAAEDGAGERSEAEAEAEAKGEQATAEEEGKEEDGEPAAEEGPGSGEGSETEAEAEEASSEDEGAGTSRTHSPDLRTVSEESSGPAPRAAPPEEKESAGAAAREAPDPDPDPEPEPVPNPEPERRLLRSSLPQTPSIVGPWDCPICTFKNLVRTWQRAECEMCNSRRPQPTSSPRYAGGPSEVIAIDF